MNIRIRPAHGDEKQALYELSRRAYLDVVTRQFGRWDETAQRAAFDEKWNERAHQAILLDGELVGALVVKLEVDALFIRELQIAPEHQGRGYGTAVLRQQMARAVGLGRPVRLRVLRENRALTLYLRQGFAKVGEIETHHLLEWTPRSTPPAWRAPCPLPDRFETDRLVIRHWEASDAGAMLRAMNVDRGTYQPWIPILASDARTEEECLTRIERFRAARERTDPACDDYVLGLFDRTNGEAVGGTGLHRIAFDVHQAEVGYWVRADRRGTSICSEAVAGLLTWAFTPHACGGWGLRRLEIVCAGANLASQAVPQKLSLRLESRLVGRRWVEGLGWDDTLVFGVLASEWASRSSK